MMITEKKEKELKIANQKRRELQEYIIKRITMDIILMKKDVTNKEDQVWIKQGMNRYIALGKLIAVDEIPIKLKEGLNRFFEEGKIKDAEEIMSIVKEMREEGIKAKRTAVELTEY